MILNIRIEDQNYPVDVPDQIIAEGGDYFSKLDEDMDRGWQMSRSWVDKPNDEQRCQIVADRILGAIEHENSKSMIMLSAYILAKMPNLKVLDIATNGEMQETLFEF